MAFESNQINIGVFSAAADYSDSTDQFCFVSFSTATGASPNLVTVVGTSGAVVNGILQDRPSSGQAANVCTYGVSKLRFSSTHAAIAVGDVLYSRDTGAGNNASSSGFYPAAMALETLAADTSGIISVFVNPALSQRTT